jgi:pimeloyl-ACP methyl ester carboxylesterase
MCQDVTDTLKQLDFRGVTLVGHSMGGAVAYRLAMQHPQRVDRLIVEDACPPFRREQPVPERPDTPLPFDWPVVPAIVSEVNAGDPATWDSLAGITAPTLLLGGGPDSHIPQDKLADAASRIPQCTLLTIPTGHNVHTARPDEFAHAVLTWMKRS